MSQDSAETTKTESQTPLTDEAIKEIGWLEYSCNPKERVLITKFKQLELQNAGLRQEVEQLKHQLAELQKDKEMFKEGYEASEGVRYFMQFPRGYWEDDEDSERIDAAKTRLDKASLAITAAMNKEKGE